MVVPFPSALAKLILLFYIKSSTLPPELVVILISPAKWEALLTVDHSYCTMTFHQLDFTGCFFRASYIGIGGRDRALDLLCGAFKINLLKSLGLNC